jgi:hypothetical protein
VNRRAKKVAVRESEVRDMVKWGIKLFENKYGTIAPLHTMKAYGRVEVQFHSFLTFGTRSR